jgi:hypothetical protein
MVAATTVPFLFCVPQASLPRADEWDNRMMASRFTAQPSVAWKHVGRLHTPEPVQ